jgi:Ran GTPase-activating protein (RanGAP) involved in mRNA processing and transport
MSVNMPEIVNQLRQNSLTTLDLSYNGLSGCDLVTSEDEGIIADALEHNTYIALNDNLDPEDAGLLADALKHNTSLTTLDLRQDDIASESANLLADALKHNTRLAELQLVNGNLTPEDAGFLADALKHNTTLTTLKIDRERNINPAIYSEIETKLVWNRDFPFLAAEWCRLRHCSQQTHFALKSAASPKSCRR